MIAYGSVLSARSGSVEARIAGAAVGDGVRIVARTGVVNGTVVALNANRVLVAAHGSIDGVAAGDTTMLDRSSRDLPLGTALLGRSISADGAPLDGGVPPRGRHCSALVCPPPPCERRAVTEPLWTGVRAIDALLTLGRGARLGIFGPPGTGKSTLLQMLVEGADADAVVIALVGERGREAESWMQAISAHTSIVCATSDRSAAERVRAAEVAMAQACALGKRGLHVLLIVDSLARYAAALREVLLSAGEPVGRGGYPAGVFAHLARYVEAAGATREGSVTMLASVLSDGDERDPVSDAARSLLDGHLQLSPAKARAGCFPAIDVPASVSRTMPAVTDAGHREDAGILRLAISALAQSEDLRAAGIAPADPAVQRAAHIEAAIEAFLRQRYGSEPSSATLSSLADLADRLR